MTNLRYFFFQIKKNIQPEFFYDILKDISDRLPAENPDNLNGSTIEMAQNPHSANFQRDEQI